ncbi:MAG: lysophospholipid acyltransferase family protein [Tsuneonella sp.]
MSVVRSLAFYVAFYLGTVVYVLAALAVLPIGPRPFRAVVHGWSRHQRRCARIFAGIRVRVEGTVPSGPVLVVMKHESFFEAIDLPTLLLLPVPFAKQELFSIPGWGATAAAYGCVPVAREAGARALREMLAAARAHLAEGRPLALFPEGTRVPHGVRAPLQSGFAGLYKLLALPVVPVAVNSGPLYHRLWKRAGTVTYRIGETIPPGLPREDAERRVLDAINALNPARHGEGDRA